MKRPKIILACLLRSASALDVNRKPVMDGYISLRQAKRSDVSSISRVNLATLPENYNHQFYVNHIAQWPDLALVAEHVPSEQAVSSGGSIMRKINPFNGHDPNRSSGKVIGYVLGKVEGHATTGISRSAANQKTNGHVTSIAVLSDYRGLRIGSELLAQLHHTMVVNHRSSKCCLNVRMSNRPATRLYSDKMGYEVAKVTKGYYNDGEDAFFMKKQLSEYDVLGDQALLPRVIADFRQQQQIAYGGYQNPPISTSYRQKPGQYGGGQYSEYNSDGYVVPDHNYNDFGEQYEYNDEYGRPLSSSSRSYYKYTSLYDRMSR